MDISLWISRAERYCSVAERCPQQVREHLRQWGAEPRETENVIEALKANRFLDEERFCRAFTHDKVAYQSWGRMKIRAALMAYRLPSAVIEVALDDIDETAYNRNLSHLIQQKKGQPYEKIVRFLLQRGFEMGEITTLLRAKS